MSKCNIANLKKTIYYLKRNGLRDTYLAALERIRQKEDRDYTYCAPTAEILEKQKEQSLLNNTIKFSILVPTYRTDEAQLRAMLDSVLTQSYGNWELLLADASGDDSVSKVVKEYEDKRIRYLPLRENGGISDNTNAALEAAEGDYIGLLDHDDLLTADALFEMNRAITEAEEKGVMLKLLYSDEDKCDENAENYYEPHYKTEFNLDLILTNHYICHFTVMEASLMKQLHFRREYDGAQDHDLVLRAIREILTDEENRLSLQKEAAIYHVPKILYHWRCHRGSTAANPQSKQYAYEAGGKAIADFLQKAGIKGKVIPTAHLGFFRTAYTEDFLKQRPDAGVLGGKLIGKDNKITGGIYTKTGECPYAGLKKGFSGYMHRASLQQDAFAVDIRLMQIREELFYVAEEETANMTGKQGKLSIKDGIADCSALSLSEEEFRGLSMEICKKVSALGYRIVWNPNWTNR